MKKIVINQPNLGKKIIKDILEKNISIKNDSVMQHMLYVHSYFSIHIDQLFQ